MSKGLFLSKPVIGASIAAGLGSILLVGLLSGLVARPNNCIEPTTTQAPTNAPTSVPTSVLTNAQTSVSTTRITNPPATSPTSTSTSSTTRTTITAQTPATRTVPPLTTQSTTVGVTTTRNPNSIRLPEYIKPTNYNLYLKVFFSPTMKMETSNITESKDETDYFEGTVLVDFALTQSSNRIVLHCDNRLKILDTIQLTYVSNGQTINIREDQHAYAENQFYIITLDNNLPVGNYKLRLEYTGNYGPSTNIVGFYKTKYIEDGQIKSIVTTKFEPLDARRAFPCFDEPALKASFEITIEHPSGTKAFSNWPEGPREVIAGSRYRTVFQKTFPMSTYLAAWAVVPEDFEFEEATTQRGIKIRILARKSAIRAGLAKFAVAITKQSVDYFQNVYFDDDLKAIPPKIDQIAFPDFQAGAMEHWGFVGYKETNLLYSETKNTLADKQAVAMVIAHEIAHFWFGNLVTCSWWDELWLNEAMARFLQFKAVGYIYPEWDVDNQFLTSYQIPIMYDDGLQVSQPVSSQVITNADIGNAFSSITYDKGSSLLRMLESTVSEENFRLGLNNYLRQNEFGASVSDDFYNKLQLPKEMTDAGVTAKQYMDNWLLQINYPEVSVQLDTVNSRTRVILKQNRFLLSEEGIEGLDITSPYDYKWLIYLQCKAGGTYNPIAGLDQHLNGDITEFNYFMKDKEAFYDLDRRYTWVKCNKDFRGYYATDYSRNIFSAFTHILLNKPEVFDIADRTNLIHVSYSLAYLGTQSYAIPALLTNYLERIETEYVPWRAFTWHMNKIANLLEHRPGFIELKGFGEYMLNTLISRGWNFWDDSGSHTTRLLKTNLIDFHCRIQNDECLRKATEVFHKINPSYFNDPNNVDPGIPPNLRALVYKYHVQNTYEYLDTFKIASVYQITNDPNEKSYVLRAIAQTRLPWLLDAQIYELFAPMSMISPQDFFSVLIYISRNPSGRHLAWYAIRHFWYDIIVKFGLSSRSLANSVKSIVETFDNFFLLEEMLTFYQSTNPGVGAFQRLQSIDIVVHNILWIEEREPNLKENLFIPLRQLKNNN